MKDKVINIVAEIAEVPAESLSLKTNLMSDLDLESLDLVELVSEFESQFGVEIPDQDIKTIQTIGDIVAFLEKHEAKK